MIGKLVRPKSKTDCRGYSHSRLLTWDKECLKMRRQHHGLIIARDAFLFVGFGDIPGPRVINTYLVVWSFSKDEKGSIRHEWAWHAEEQLEVIQ